MEPLVLVLRSIQASANNVHSGASLSWESINRALQAYGAPDIDYDRFAKFFDSNPAIQNIVDNFDHNGVALKTDQSDSMAQQPMNPAQNHNMMAAAAKRATKLGK